MINNCKYESVNIVSGIKKTDLSWVVICSKHTLE